MDLGRLDNWLPWGGLIYPAVVRNKDNSLMGFIRYVQGEGGQPIKTSLDLGRGWSVWSEKSHFAGRDELTLTLCWNPFVEKKSGIIQNCLDDVKRFAGEAEQYFAYVLVTLQKEVSQTVPSRLLQDEEVLQYLAGTISGEPSSIEMYRPPLYLDAVLSRKVGFKVFGNRTDKKNDLYINGQGVTVVSVLGWPNVSIMDTLCRAFKELDYRLVKRMLFWDEEGAEKEIRGYMASWCKGRRTLKDFMSDQLLKPFNGIYTEMFIFRFAEDERDAREVFVESVFRQLAQPHVFEDYNRKHCWWSSIPGCFRANVVTPLGGIDDLSELLMGGAQDVQAESL